MKTVTQFLAEVRVELSRVVWPRPQELYGAALVVLCVVVFFSIYLGCVDLCFYRIAQRLFA